MVGRVDEGNDRSASRGGQEWAGAIRRELAGVLKVRGGQVHFRPSSSGVTMVGLHPERPQRGKGGYRDLAKLASDFDAEFRKHCVDIDQGRPTEEKELQSWLVAHAQTHDGALTPLFPNGEVVFVTDEIPVPHDSGRIVCDLLAARIIGPGRIRPVLIELKSERAMKRLVEQVTSYAAIIDAHPKLFEDLYGALLGKPVLSDRTAVRFEGGVEKHIVWPAPPSGGEPRRAKLATLDIAVHTYTRTANGFAFG